jgi:type I restriction enzyme S subunit
MSKTWPEVPLADIAKPILRTVAVLPGRDYRTIGVKWWGEGAYERQTIDGSRTAAKTLSLVRQGDLIINKIWVRHGSTAVAGADVDGCAASGEFPTFALDENRVLPRWLHWQTKTRGFWAKCDTLSQGTSGKNRIKPELFLTIRVPLPSPAEQRRIVERIEELAAKIEEAKALRRQAMEETELLSKFGFRAISHDVVDGRSLNEICLQITDGEHATPLRVPEPGVPLATAKNVRDGFLDMAITDFVDRETAEKCWRRCRPTHGDVLMVCVGATTGRVCRLVNPPDMVIVRSVALLRPAPDKVDGRYLEYALESREVQTQIWDLVKQAAQPCLYLNRMARIRTPVPALAEQRRIVAELDALQAEIDVLKRLQAETSAELDALLPSILDKAFKGEL